MMVMGSTFHHHDGDGQLALVLVLVLVLVLGRNVLAISEAGGRKTSSASTPGRPK